MFKDKQARFESLSARMIKLQTIARSLWHEGKQGRAVRIGDIIARIAEIRLKYIYQ